MPSYALGCDIGGTFTDFVLLDLDTGAMRVDKHLTTPSDPVRGVINGVTALLIEVPGFLAVTSHVVHGTTLAINALIERKGARTGILTTRGFRDTLEIRWGARGELWDLSGQLPEPLVPREWRLEVSERCRADGQVLVPIDEQEVDSQLKHLLAAGVRSLAVCLLHAYANPSAERAIRDIALRSGDWRWITLSSDVLPQMGEYDRCSATAANAYLRPVVGEYLPRLEQELTRHGLGEHRLSMLLSEGSRAPVATAIELPVRIVESGPVGGVIAAQKFGEITGATRILTLDIGGTTAKSCLVVDGVLPVAEDHEVARMYRFRRGSGIPLNVPSSDLLEIGAGGGSIAKVNELGMVQIGPESAGADPGPACYGRGGVHPTLTDADLVLGLLNPATFLAGRMQLDPSLAEIAIERDVAGPLGLSVTGAASVIREVAIEKMSGAMRLQVAQYGMDPADFTLVAFGGAGPLYAAELAHRLNIGTSIIPPAAGVLSALGMVLAPQAYTEVCAYLADVRALNLDDLEAAYARLEQTAMERVLLGAASAGAEAHFVRGADLRYRGQGRSLNVRLPDGRVDLSAVDVMVAGFEAEYSRRFGYVYREQQLQLTGIRTTAIVAKGRDVSPIGPGATRPAPAPFTSRLALRGTPLEIACTVVKRVELGEGSRVRGPALIEERESTTFIGRPADIEVDEFGSLVIRLS
jgi:N-methylhydantoinase A